MGGVWLCTLPPARICVFELLPLFLQCVFTEHLLCVGYTKPRETDKVPALETHILGSTTFGSGWAEVE